MLERVYAGVAHVLVGGRVMLNIELRQRAEPVGCAMCEIVGERVFGLGDCVGTAIPGRVEDAAWLPPFEIAHVHEVIQRLDARIADVRVEVQIPGGVEVQVRPPAFPVTFEEEVPQRLVLGLEARPVGVVVVMPVEQARLPYLVEFGRGVVALFHPARFGGICRASGEMPSSRPSIRKCSKGFSASSPRMAHCFR